MSKIKAFISILLLCLSAQAVAGFYAQAGLHFGGDTLVTAVFTDGSTDSIKAGGLLSGSLGYETVIDDSMFYRLSAGLKVDTFLAENSDVFFERYPLEALLFISGENLQLGFGVSHHIGVRLTGDAAFSLPTINFEDATGYVLQLDVPLNENAYLGLKYTGIDYQVSGGGQKINGNSIGIIIGIKFGS